MELDPQIIQELVEQARRARSYARVPTSGFAVGAALLAEDGTIYSGCNVEIASVLYSICAERTALVKAVSEGQQKFSAVAVVADSDMPVSPCGQCRQALFDFGPGLMVIMATTRNEQLQMLKISELLPHAYVRPKK
jgi:cytidine deaminase